MRIARRWWIVALGVLLALAIGGVYLATVTPSYRATVVLASGYGATTTGLIPPDEFLDAQRRRVFSSPVLAAGARAAPDISRLEDALKVQTSTGDGTITITVKASAASDAAAAANAIAEAYLRDRDVARSAAARALTALTAQRDEQAAARRSAERALVDLRASAQGAGGEAGKMAGGRLEQLQSALSAAQLELTQASAAASAARSAATDPEKRAALIEASRPSGIFAALDQQRNQLAETLRSAEAELERLRQAMLPQHPVFIAQHRKIEQLRAERDMLDARYAETCRAHLLEQQRAAERKVEELGGLVAEQRALAADQLDRAERVAKLEASLQRADAALADADARLRAAMLRADTGGPAVTLAQPAQPPHRPFHPDHTRVLLTALLGGLAIGAGIASLGSLQR